MEVILLEKIRKLGNTGDVVTVKDGFARNYLLPYGKCLRKNQENLKMFEEKKAFLEEQNKKRIESAKQIFDEIDNKEFVAIVNASEEKKLYGSITQREVVEILGKSGFKVAKKDVILNIPIKMLGVYPIEIELNPDVVATINLNIARNNREAEKQLKNFQNPANTDVDAFEKKAVVNKEPKMVTESAEGLENQNITEVEEKKEEEEEIIT